MKRLLLLRHAKSSCQHRSLADHDRPLNKRGEKRAGRIGDCPPDAGLIPDHVLLTTAPRAALAAFFPPALLGCVITTSAPPEPYAADGPWPLSRVRAGPRPACTV